MHFVADELARRGTAVRHLHVWDDYDRFRKVPAGVDPAWADHIGRPLSAVPDPWECHASWADHFKEPLRDALHALGVDMDEVSQTERYRAGHYREQVLHAVRHRDEIERCWPATGPRARLADLASRSRRRPRSRSRSPTTRRRPAAPPGPRALPVQAVLPRLRARHGHPDVVRRRHHRPGLHLRVRRLLRHQPRDPGRGQAGLEGRLADAVGRRARRLRAGGHGPRDAGVVVHRRPRAGRVGLRHAAAGLVRLRLRRVRGRAEDVVVRRRRPDRGRRAAGPGGAGAALALRTTQPQADLRHRLRARGGAALRRVGRARAQGGVRQARRRGARPRAGRRRPSPPGRCPSRR